MLINHNKFSAFAIRSALLLLLTLLPFYISAAPQSSQSQTPAFPAASAKYDTASDSSPVNANRITQLVIGLFVVLICILALAWLARRFNRLQSTPDGSLRLLGGLSMGARERVVLVQVGTQQLLLGVAPGRINTLHVLTETLDSTSGFSVQNSDKGFAEKLSAAITRNKPS